LLGQALANDTTILHCGKGGSKTATNRPSFCPWLGGRLPPSLLSRFPAAP
jgi:hypothetical protein